MKIKYIVLAKSIPEYSKRDNSLYTCSLGYSPELGLIRVYPLPIKSMNKWDVYEIDVQKNKKDSRDESWQLSSYAKYENWVGLNDDAKYLYKADAKSTVDIIQSMPCSTLKTLNEKKKSIGLVKVNEHRIYWDENDRFINSGQFGLFEDVSIADFTNYTKETKRKESRIYFRDDHGEHDIQYNEWQVYEYQRKFKADEGAFRFLKDKNILLVGNMHNHRNIWIGLSMFRFYDMTLFYDHPSVNITYPPSQFVGNSTQLQLF